MKGRKLNSSEREGIPLSRVNKERQYLIDDFTIKDTWRVFRIMAEFVEGFEAMAHFPPAVTIFGSSRVRPGDSDYQKAEKIAQLLVKEGYCMITGGGPGIMEAANKGAKEAGGESVGLNIELPMEQASNEYITTLVTFRYFFVRKVMFVKYARAFVIMPGGFGTMDELFESVTLIQTNKIKPFPIVVVDKDYWSGLVAWMKGKMVKEGKISLSDFDIIRMVDEPEEVVEAIRTWNYEA